MNDRPKDTVLLVCGCPDTAATVLEKLYDGGFGVIGPAPTAGLALALAAQTIPTVAIVASSPLGRRDAWALGHDLMRDWGLRTWVLDGVDDDGIDAADPEWMANPRRLANLTETLLGLEGVASSPVI